MILPISEGKFPTSAPGLITSHANPKRARSQIRREVTPEAFRAHALLAIARLAPRVPNSAGDLKQAATAALASDDRELITVGAYLADQQNVDVDQARLSDLTRHPDPGVRNAVDKLLKSRPEA